MTEATHTPHQHPGALVGIAVDRARVLAAVPRDDRRTSRWSHEAAHVGDLSVLALALLDR